MPSTQAKWVLIVDDSELMCSSLALAFEAFEDIELLATAWSGEEALHICKQFVPDVVLMDMLLPDMNGVEITRRLHQQNPHLRVIFLSTSAQTDAVRAAYEVGASDYLVKHTRIDEIAGAIRG